QQQRHHKSNQRYQAQKLFQAFKAHRTCPRSASRPRASSTRSSVRNAVLMYQRLRRSGNSRAASRRRTFSSGSSSARTAGSSSEKLSQERYSKHDLPLNPSPLILFFSHFYYLVSVAMVANPSFAMSSFLLVFQE